MAELLGAISPCKQHFAPVHRGCAGGEEVPCPCWRIAGARFCQETKRGGAWGKPPLMRVSSRSLCVGLPHAVRVFAAALPRLLALNLQDARWGGSIARPITLHKRRLISPTLSGWGRHHCRPGEPHQVCEIQQAPFPSRLDHRRERNPGGRE